MELLVESFGLELAVDGIDAVGHNERRAFMPFRQKVAHGPVERTCHTHRFALAPQQRKRTFDLPDCFRTSVQNPLPGLLNRHI